MKRTARLILMFLLFFCFLSPSMGTVNGAEIFSKTKISGHQGRKWAFCVGIGDYKDSKIRDLPKARNDAKGLARVIREHGGFDHVLVFTDDRGKKDPQFPSKKNIRSALQRSIKHIKPWDLILFSFSGHGITHPSGKAFLLTVDTRLNNLSGTGLPLREVLDFVKKTGVKKSIIFIDASRKKIIKGRSSRGVYPDRYLKEGVTAIFHAARKGVYSYDDQDSDYGLFARVLISGLEGEADLRYGGNSDGIVTLIELAAYVREGISRRSIESRKRQKPYIKILNRGMVDLIVASAQKVKIHKEITARPPAPGIEEIAKRKENRGVQKEQGKERAKVIEKVVTETRIKVKKQLEAKPGSKKVLRVKEPEKIKEKVEKVEKSPEKPGEEIQGEVTAGPPAPGIEEILEGKEVNEKIQVAQAPVPAEAAKKKVVEEEPVKKPEPAMNISQEKEDGEKALELEEERRAKEKELLLAKKEKERRDLSRVISREEKQWKLESIPKPVKVEPIRLRKKGKNFGAKELRAMLIKYNFYSTCWNYNGDFCNPDGNFINHFKDNNNNTVSDQATELMWQKLGSSKVMTWIEAREYVDKLNREGFAGHSDWRIPTIEELASLMERSWKNSDLFIDAMFDEKQRYCWSLDTNSRNKAWKANFHLGFFMDFPLTAQNSVRLVRSLP